MRQGRGNKRCGAVAQREGRSGRVRAKRGKRTDRAETNLHPLIERRKAARSNRKGAARQRNRRMGKGRRVEGEQSGLHSDPGGTPSPGGLRILGPRQPWHTT